MSSQYFVPRPGRSSWEGVCEVRDGDERYYYHHQQWPLRSEVRIPFYGGTLADLTDPVHGWWDVMVDEDLVMDVDL